MPVARLPPPWVATTWTHWPSSQQRWLAGKLESPAAWPGHLGLPHPSTAAACRLALDPISPLPLAPQETSRPWSHSSTASGRPATPRHMHNEFNTLNLRVYHAPRFNCQAGMRTVPTDVVSKIASRAWWNPRNTLGPLELHLPTATHPHIKPNGEPDSPNSMTRMPLTHPLRPWELDLPSPSIVLEALL